MEVSNKLLIQAYNALTGIEENNLMSLVSEIKNRNL